MSDLTLDDDTHDLKLDLGDLTLTSSTDAIRQHIKQRLLSVEGEWFLNTGHGLPWFDQGPLGLGQKNPDVAAMTGYIAEAIARTPGVLDVQSIDATVDRATRNLSVTFEANTIEGSVLFSEALELT